MNNKELEKKVLETIKNHKLINKNEKILVALSGGKDSAVLAHLLKKFEYNIIGFHIDLKIGKYSESCLEKVNELCNKNNIPLIIYDTKKELGSSMCYLRSAIQSKKSLKNCAICGVIKKWIFNKEARKIKEISKIATGHNLDDEAQTFLLNVLKGSLKLSANVGPITKNQKNKKFITRIKPLFYIPEKDILKYCKSQKIPFHPAKCPCALDSYRIQVRNFLEKTPTKEKQNIIKNFEKLYPKISNLKDKTLKFCEICSEPARNNICKKCELMNLR